MNHIIVDVPVAFHKALNEDVEAAIKALANQPFGKGVQIPYAGADSGLPAYRGYIYSRAKATYPNHLVHTRVVNRTVMAWLEEKRAVAA